jgi:arylsulfatase
MAVYAATVDIMDHNIGRIVAHLKETGEYDNTLIFFLSDNGGCAEWDPYGFDKLDSTLNIVHTGEDLKKVGSPESYVSYGTGWANASDTPWRLYKHYAQEGGIRTPMIAHWPQGLKTKPGALASEPGYLTDFMPTVVELCGGRYPTERNGVAILPTEGVSLVPTFQNKKLKPRTLCVEHEGNRMVRETDWKLVALSGRPWELYDLAKDPTEMHDLSASEPQRVMKLNADWNDWAVRCNVIPRKTPQIAGRSLAIRCDVTPDAPASTGVILAQGGSQRGYALYLKAGIPIFGVREKGTLYTAIAPTAPTGKFSLEAHLADDGAMTLAVNGTVVGHAKAPGVIELQPQDPLTINEDTLSPVGDYQTPNRFKGKVEHVSISTGKLPGDEAQSSAEND